MSIEKNDSVVAEADDGKGIVTGAVEQTSPPASSTISDESGESCFQPSRNQRGGNFFPPTYFGNLGTLRQ